MKQLAERIRTILLAKAAVIGAVGQRVYWELGADNDTLPLIQFSIQETPSLTKDNRTFTTVVRCYDVNMDVVGDLYEHVKDALVSARGNFQGGGSGLTDDEKKEAYAELTIEFKQ